MYTFPVIKESIIDDFCCNEKLCFRTFTHFIAFHYIVDTHTASLILPLLLTPSPPSDLCR